MWGTGGRSPERSKANSHSKLSEPSGVTAIQVLLTATVVMGRDGKYALITNWRSTMDKPILDNLTPETATDEQVIAQAVQLAKSFAKLWNDQSKWLVELKARFQVRQGSRGKQLLVEGKKLFWDEVLRRLPQHHR